VEHRATPEETKSLATPTPGGKHILLVEDNKMVREMYREILQLGGYAVTAVETIDDALTAIDGQATGPAFDLMVSDAVLPDGEPSRAIDRFREQGWKPVLVCSGYIDSDELLEGLRHSDYEFLQKPFSNDTLLKKVGKLWQQEPPQTT
jgi:two-component system C4-dicarboxylate transport response regulator DctD